LKARATLRHLVVFGGGERFGEHGAHGAGKLAGEGVDVNVAVGGGGQVSLENSRRATPWKRMGRRKRRPYSRSYSRSGRDPAVAGRPSRREERRVGGPALPCSAVRR
jgi:hypothetical protein